MVSTIAYESPTSMSLSNNCNLDFKVPPEDAKQQELTLGINHFKFKNLAIATTISPNSAAFAILATFDIATRSSFGFFFCENPNREAACLTMDIATSFSLVASEPPN